MEDPTMHEIPEGLTPRINLFLKMVIIGSMMYMEM
jgi:hypothetical protein